MPFRIDEHRAKIQFITSREMPSLVYKAAVRTNKVSNTVYIQHAVCEALSRDLGIPVEDLIAALPPARGSAATIFGSAGKARRGMQATNEEVR